LCEEGIIDARERRNMKKALIDNWTIENIINNYNLGILNESVEFQMLISALVLWDEVCYLDNGYCEWWNDKVENSEELKVLKMLTPLTETGMEQVRNRANEDYNNIYRDNYLGVVAKGALEYLYMAVENDICYMPFGKRAEFILENDLYKKSHQYYTRMDAISVLDKEIFHHYENLNSCINKAKFGINANSIFNYVKGNASSLCEMVDVIADLKKKKMVKKFKSWVEKMECVISKDTILDNPPYVIKECIDELKEIKNMQYKDVSTNFSAGLPFVEIGVNVTIPIKKLMKPNLVFPAFLYNHAIRKNSVLNFNITKC